MGLSNPLHIAFVLVLLLLVFGAKRLPEMGRSLGSGMRGFKDTLTGEGEHHDSSTVEPAALAPAVAPAEPAVAPAEPAVAPAAPLATPVTPIGVPAGQPRMPAA